MINPDECLDGEDLNQCFNLVSDLGVLDVMRARDHGIPLYNDLREAYGLPRVTSFTEITREDVEEFPTDDPLVDIVDPINDPDILEFLELQDGEGNVIEFGTDAAEGEAIVGIRRTTLAARLKAIYGDVDQVDSFVGMVSEPIMTGSELGELQHAIWKQQFEALRDGDRFFHENDFGLRLISLLFKIDYRQTLAEVIVNNTDLEPGDVQDNIFFVPNEEE